MIKNIELIKELYLIQKRKSFISFNDIMMVYNCSRDKAFFILRNLESNKQLIQSSNGVQIVFKLINFDNEGLYNV